MEIYTVCFDKIKKYKSQNGIIFNDNSLLINEQIEDHIVQILFIIKESIGWKEFTKDLLVKSIKKDIPIYLTNWIDGENFVSLFPSKIDYFLENFCDKKIIENKRNNLNRNLSIKQKEQLEMYLIYNKK